MSMEGSERRQMAAVDKALNGPAIITVYYARPSWVMPDGTVKGWEVLIEKDKGQPQWVLCYSQGLITIGLHEVAFSRNARHERTIKPWKGNADETI